MVKNVTGYDLCKLLAGSWGTLSVMTEVTLKVMPKAESERTLVLRGLDDVAANKAMTTALGSSFDVSGVAHLPASSLRGVEGSLLGLGSLEQAVTLIRLEGIGASVVDRAKSVSGILASFGAVDMIEDDMSRAAWAAVRDVQPFAASGPLGSRPVWRIVCPPASGGAFGQALARDTGGDVIYDWSGGLIWAAPTTGAGCPRCPAARTAQGDWWPRHLDPCHRSGAQCGRRFSSSAGGGCCARAARQGQLRSQEHPQPRPHGSRLIGNF